MVGVSFCGFVSVEVDGMLTLVGSSCTLDNWFISHGVVVVFSFELKNCKSFSIESASRNICDFPQEYNPTKLIW